MENVWRTHWDEKIINGKRLIGGKLQMAKDGDALTFDEVMLDETYKVELDRRIGKAVETAKAKWEFSSSKTLEENSKKIVELESALAKANKEIASQQVVSKLSGKDYLCKPEFLKFVAGEINSLVTNTNDFDTAAAKFKEENPQYFGEKKTVKVNTGPTLKTGASSEPKDDNDRINAYIRGEEE